MSFNEVDPKQSFPELEEKVLKFWKENEIFEKSIENRINSKEFNFYDGPPFATGTPHYGHILASTIKDLIPRYQTMKGKRVDRVFGWDCHGLPIENIVEKKLGISGIEDIQNKVGVYKFNEECKNNVFIYTNEWRKTIDRMGRWVDMDNSYKTMDSKFMESIWRVFKSLYDKGLIYEGYRVVPYCPRCSTPLSNFEVNLGYENKQDKAITVKFKVLGENNKYILAWTTTPWTLVSNLGLAVGENIIYVNIKDLKTSQEYILAKDRVGVYFKSETEYEIVEEFKGSDLVGVKYDPLFKDFLGNTDNGGVVGSNAFSVVLGHHVSTESGTGIVHMAPAYGEDDYIIGEKCNLGFVSHIDDTGNTINLLEDNNIWVFDYNELVIKKLKELDKIVHLSTIEHSYPFCWRCSTPLIYRAISAWYVSVEKIRDKIVSNNEKINWIPENIKHGRFGKWLEGARDWNISRNRFWGSTIPIWKDVDSTCELCIGSIQELYQYNQEYGQIKKEGDKYYYVEDNVEIDLHKHFVDKIKLKHPITGKELFRIPEVLDCWFESGGMPYASKHYPFENKENFKFPADFISEGLDQTRGWFYTLIVLSTALFDDTSFLNCVVSGIILAEDGKKMSKSLKNYPEPELIINKYGADSMRFYLMSTPVVEAQTLRFSEQGVQEIVKKFILPLWNTFYFFVTYANIDKIDVSKLTLESTNKLDNWIISELNILIKNVDNSLSEYKLQLTTRYILEFIDKLTNWYIRRSRRRFWKSENDFDKHYAYNTLYNVLVEFSKIIAPFCPFISDYLFKSLTGKLSVHLEDFPEFDLGKIDENLNSDMTKVQFIVSLGLSLRTNNKIRVRQPLNSITIFEKLDNYYMDIIKDELNVKQVIYSDDVGKFAKKICKPNAKLIGPKYGKDVQSIILNAKNGNFEELGDGKVKVLDFILDSGEYDLFFEKVGEGLDIQADYGVVIAMDTKITDELLLEGYARDLIRYIQEARKEINYNVDDRIYLQISGNGIDSLLKKFSSYIEIETLSTIQHQMNKYDIEKTVQIDEYNFTIKLYNPKNI